MNFTAKVKTELAETMPNARHCKIAELAGILAVTARKEPETGEMTVSTENRLLTDKTEKLIKKIFSVDISGRLNYDRKRAGKEILSICFTKSETEDILKAVSARLRSGEDGLQRITVGPQVYRLSCCKRAFIRGAFLGCGSLTDPEKDYHLEYSVQDEETASCIISLMSDFDIEARATVRKKQHVVYVKDCDRIVDLLNVMEAHVLLMELENIRILKDVRNRVNRRVNCETANIAKAVTAAAKQCSDIRLVDETVGFDKIDPGLAQTAKIRLENPDATLRELVELHDGRVSKSGINHRLQKLSEIAAKLRNGSDAAKEDWGGKRPANGG